MKSYTRPAPNPHASTVRRSALCLALLTLLQGLLQPAALAQTYPWSGLGGDLNFGTGANWQGDSAPAVGSGVTLDFTGGTQPTPYNNYGAYNDFGSWFLDNATTADFVITGSSIGLWSKIENDSSNFLGLGISNIAARAAIQLNPVGGNLTISNSSLSGAIFLDNNQSLTVWGDNVNTSRTLTLDTTLSQGNGVGGSGSLIVNQKATVALLQNNTYGATTLNSGTVQVGNGGTSGSLGSGVVSNNVAGGMSRRQLRRVQPQRCHHRHQPVLGELRHQCHPLSKWLRQRDPGRNRRQHQLHPRRQCRQFHRHHEPQVRHRHLHGP